MINDQVLYYVEEKDPNGTTLGSFLGVNVQTGIDKGGEWVGFHTTIRGRQLYGQLLDEGDAGFTWEIQDASGTQMGTLVFTVLTRKKYDANIRNQVTPGVPKFSSDAELWEWYRRQFGTRGYHY